jgi:hypothetical protein
MSTYHFTDLVQSAAVKMGTLAMYRPSPVATSGATNGITDTSLALTVNEMAHALAIVTRDAGGAGAAPEGEWATVVSNTATAFTFATGAFSAAPATGDEIMVIRPKYPLTEWRRSANVALKSFGPIPLWDITTTLVSGQTEYTLPATILQPYEIYIQTGTTLLDYEWEKLPTWTVQHAVPGTVKTIRIPERYVVAGKLLGIVYKGDHPSVYAWNDHIDIPIELAACKLAWEMVNRGGITDRNRTQSEKILAELNDAMQKFSIPNQASKKPKFLTWGNSSGDID